MPVDLTPYIYLGLVFCLTFLKKPCLRYVIRLFVEKLK